MKKLNSVLLVDDDEATNFVNQLIIRKLDIADELLIARNGKDALTMIQEFCQSQQAGTGQVPKLILLDINMPVMDGFGFLEAFEALDCPGKEEVSIIMLSTSLNPRDVERAKKFMIKDFMNKPLTADGLNNMLEKHLA